MPPTSDELALYLHLARASEVRRRPLVRDKLLVLAGKTAVDMQLDPIAEHCRARVLAHNPAHILRNYPTMSAALDDDAFRFFFKRLAQAYSRERAEHMLRSLGIEMAGERHVYADDLEYAAALLGTTPDRLAKPALDSVAGKPHVAKQRSSTHAPTSSFSPTSGGVRWQIRRVAPLVALAVTILVVAIVAIFVRSQR